MRRYALWLLRPTRAEDFPNPQRFKRRTKNGWLRRFEKAGSEEETWTRSVAVGSEHYIIGVKQGLGIKASHREIVAMADGHLLRESPSPYVLDSDIENAILRSDNTLPRDEFREATTA
jgi:hypothetical protein